MPAHGIAEVQDRLKNAGYPISKIDGKAGMNTRALIGAYQHAQGLKTDCWPSEATLKHLRATQAKKNSLGAK
jgi:peptidoglycan hydrolase-like protein with peptidoglycan-binding domain